MEGKGPPRRRDNADGGRATKRTATSHRRRATGTGPATTRPNAAARRAARPASAREEQATSSTPGRRGQGDHTTQPPGGNPATKTRRGDTTPPRRNGRQTPTPADARPATATDRNRRRRHRHRHGKADRRRPHRAPKHAGGKRRPQEQAKRPAAAAEEKRATATKPDRERSDGRNDTPSAPPAQGAKAARAERTTDEAAGNNEEEATGHPPEKQGPAGAAGTHPPPAKASRPDRDTRKGGTRVAGRKPCAGRGGAAPPERHSPKNTSKPANPSGKTRGGVGKATARGGTRRQWESRAPRSGAWRHGWRKQQDGSDPWEMPPARRDGRNSQGRAKRQMRSRMMTPSMQGFGPPETPTPQQKGGDGGRGQQAAGARSHHRPSQTRRPGRAPRVSSGLAGRAGPRQRPPRDGPSTQRSACAPGARRTAGTRVGSHGREPRRIALSELRTGRLRPCVGREQRDIPKKTQSGSVWLVLITRQVINYYQTLGKCP